MSNRDKSLSETMQFRVSAELADALARQAEREGVSQSEIIRRAVAGRVGCESAPAADPDPYERVHAAARGDLQAMRDLANLSVRWAFDPTSGCDPSLCLRDGLVFARLAASHGHAADQGTFVSMVGLLAKVEGDEGVFHEFAEAIARLSLVADSGNEDATSGLLALVDTATPELMEAAKDIRASLRDVIRREDA